MGSVEMSRALGKYPLPVWCLSLSISWLIAPSTTMAAMVVSHGLRVHSVQDQGHCLWVFVPIHCPWWHMQGELHYCHPFRWCHWPLVWWVPLRTWPLRNSRRCQSALTWLRPRLCSSKLVSTLTTASNLPPLWTGSQKVLSYVFLCCIQLSFVGNLVLICVASVWLTGQMLALFSLNHIASRKNILCSAVIHQTRGSFLVNNDSEHVCMLCCSIVELFWQYSSCFVQLCKDSPMLYYFSIIISVAHFVKYTADHSVNRFVYSQSTT